MERSTRQREAIRRVFDAGQPLAKALVKVTQDKERNSLQRLASHVLEEVNVKELEFVDYEMAGDVSGYSVASEEKYWVAVNTELSPELVAEGIGREIVRRVQTMRRAADFDIADHIITYYQAEEAIKQAVTDCQQYIAQETLSEALLDGVPPEQAYAQRHRIADSDVLIAIMRASS